MNAELQKKLISLAEKYEVSSFCDSDPSQFLRWHSKLPATSYSTADVEVASFIAAMLSFGSRKQFIPKIQNILQLANHKSSISQWIKNQDYKNDFVPDPFQKSPNSEKKYYRFYSYNDLIYQMKSYLKRANNIPMQFIFTRTERPACESSENISGMERVILNRQNARCIGNTTT